ncbi:DHS-like NAD/FAD-binding domain-containing protein [Mytilinidion resinicola]|uniref:Pyruvate decarboxylase n=1 Tax=Mytilinidion resinicola TaxID=574789 RepID=A0A6A6YQZ4_9PEZI|nr:DHS-like NAD/FAD-binding domain-containing protein [Mytilinidion resinicola]KAF2811336.1 DHS-like NAD/FAD-binding domain-containing protein [Mytilinidion resinicola]
MAKHITAATTVITNPPTAAAEIDRVLNMMMRESRPVYVGLSVDIAYEMISSAPLASPITTSLLQNNPELERKVIAEILSKIERAAEPIIIVDGGAVRHQVLSEVNELVELTSFPTFVTAMGKSGVNEELPNFGGVYGGAGTHPGVKEAIESSDAVLWIGNFPSDFNTGEFTTDVKEEITIDFQRFSVKVGEVKYNVAMKYVLGSLIKELRQKSVSKSPRNVTWNPFPVKTFSDSVELKQEFLWPSLGSFFRPGDIVIGETGTSAFGLCDSKLPKGVMMFNQTVYGSIGYATGSIVGVGQSIKESGGKWKRPILVTGEGSMHLTVQAIADMLRWDLRPIIFVLNNGGYTIERLIHGKDASYNEVAIYDYSALAKALGPAHPAKYHGPVKTCGDLTKLLKEPGFGDAGCFELVELVLGRLDAPGSVIKTGAAIDEFNKAKVQKTVPGG